MPTVQLLFIEDNPADFRLMARHLEKHGVEAQCTRVGGREELEQALTGADWDAVISDYSIPQLDFTETATLLRERHEDLPLILVSGSVGEERAIELLQLGVWDFVLKDNLARLVPALERSLREALDRRARRQADAALAASETRYRRLFESSKDGLLILDAVTGRIQDLNPHLAELLGQPREALLDQPVWQTSGLREIIANEADLAALRTQESVRHDDLRLTDARGARVDIEFLASTYLADERQVIQCRFRDTTQRKAQEREIRRLSRLYATLSQISQTVVRVKSRDDLFGEVGRVTADFGGFKLVLVGGRLPHSEQITLIARGGSYEGSLADLQAFAEASADDRGPIARCLREGRPSVLSDLRLAAESLPWRAPALAHGLHAAAAIPIRFQGAVWGVFAVYDTEPHAFQDQELALLEEAARNISYAMENLEQEARRQAAEAALRASEERYRLLADNAEDFVVVAEPKGRLLYVSPSFYRVTGWTPEEVQDLDRPRLFHPDDRELVEEAVAANCAGAGVQIEYRVQCRDGSWLWVDTRAKPTLRPDGTVQHLQLWSRNITERKRIELEHLRLVAAIQQATDAIVITDTTGTILYVNPAFERITGYHREEAVGQNPRLLRSGKHDAAFYTRMWATLSRGEVWSGRIINRRKDGTLVEEDANITPVRDAAGRIANYVAVKRDVTREVQLEAQFRQAQKTEAIGQLAGGIAHDFNNILAEILLQADLELNDAQLAPPTRESIREIKQSAERAASLTRQLLLFSRRQIMQPRTVDLNEIVVNVTKMLRRILGEDIRLQLELQSTPLWTHADTGMLDQVLLNLAVNARDAMPGGGCLTIATGETNFLTQPPTAPPEVGAGRYVTLRVRDTGSGIPPEVLPRIFEPFFTTKEVGRGTGLGLATVLGIVKQHRGWIDVANNVDRGATFQIQFPATTAPATLIETTRPALQPDGGTETILLVEDEPSLRRVTRSTLEREGYQVLEAAHGPEAINLYRGASRPIDLLLTDIVLPEGLDGRGLATQLLGQQPGLRVIYMSGYSAELAGRNLALQPGQQFLQKPCSRESLLAAIRLSLDDRSSGVHADQDQKTP